MNIEKASNFSKILDRNLNSFAACVTRKFIVRKDDRMNAFNSFVTINDSHSSPRMQNERLTSEPAVTYSSILIKILHIVVVCISYGIFWSI